LKKAGWTRDLCQDNTFSLEGEALFDARDAANSQYEMALAYSARQQAGDLDKGRELIDQVLTIFCVLGARSAVAKVEAALKRFE